MVSFANEDDNKITAGDFSIESDMKVFIDMGHDTLKCAKINNGDWNSLLNHFEVPTVLVPELCDLQQQLLKATPYDFDRRTSISFKFFKQNVEALTDQVLFQNSDSKKFKRSYHQRPMINGLIQDNMMDSFTFMWEHIGQMFVQGLEASQQDDVQAGWGSINSRLMMTDPSLTMAANDNAMIRNAQRQREKICEIAFETLEVSEFSLQPAQLPMMMSELCMDGIVVDLGHEMTQIVPIFGGMTDIRKVSTYNVGGITMDSILMNQWNVDKRNNLPANRFECKYTHYRTRTKFKEELPKLAHWKPDHPNLKRLISDDDNDADHMDEDREQPHYYILPDNSNLQIDWTVQDMHPIMCYLDQSVYSRYFEDIIMPLFTGQSKTQRQSYVQRNIFGELIKPSKTPQRDNIDETLRLKKVDEDAGNKFPITNKLFKTIREFCEDEEIKEFDQLQNILIIGGGANISQFDTQGNNSGETLGTLLTKNIKEAIAAESVTGLNVILSMDPRLSILQGAKILMNLSSNKKHYVTADEYYENGQKRFELINQILI